MGYRRKSSSLFGAAGPRLATGFGANYCVRMTSGMLAVFDDARESRRLVFRDPLAVITASRPAEIPAALAEITDALARKRHVAGWFAYEMGYLLEEKLAQRFVESDTPLLQLGVYDAPSTAAPQIAGRAYAGPLIPGWSQPAYTKAFNQVQDYIAAGDIYQANLSFRAAFDFAGDPYALYARLMAESGASHCAYLDDGSRQILSLSPELFFTLSADGTLTARPMKGTAPRKGLDASARAALAASPKDRAENLMIVDLIRNDLGRIAQIGSVAVRDLFAVETYPTLHTMVSTVTARKRADAGIGDLLRALFPCGSVTGAPKIRAMEILQQVEASPRDVYCGAIGHFDPDGLAAFNVAIRTLTITGNRGVLGIGGGVVQDSTAAGEYAECLLKARFFENIRRKIGLIETLRFDNGFVRLDRHLARMQKSARLFGIGFDAAKAQEALDDAIAGATGPLRVRLTLDEAGTHAATAAPLAANPPFWTYRLSPHRVQSRDLLQQHKTDWREVYDSEAARLGSDEVIFCNERGEVAEGARSNIFVPRDGVLLTPPRDAGALGGCLRAELIESGRAREATLFPADLAGEMFFGNSLRGLIPARPA